MAPEPRLRTHRAPAAAALAALVLALPATAYAGERDTHTAHRAPLFHLPTLAPKPTPPPSLAGREAGEGRQRPGRRASPPAHTASIPPSPQPPSAPFAPVAPPISPSVKRPAPFAPLTPATPATPIPSAASRLPAAPVTPVTSTPAAAVGEAEPHAGPPARERRIPSLSLGTGFALMGLGLGYIALRLRRH
ncbi:hypothetical protein [Streptomyces sp. NPDC059828]|uniref:hypothetical protein n=1 Tax=Streptomyces sp. NPDC059828 TaxID=3346965 RepID=UPI003659E5BF